MQEADEEKLELRLLTEPSFVEEFDTIVDEVTDQYVKNELADSERAAFKKSFLTTPEGKKKVGFAIELLERAASERGAVTEKPVVGTDRELDFFSWISTFFGPNRPLRLAATTAAVVIIAGGIFLISKSFRGGSMNYMAVNLSISAATRGGGPAPARVKLESGMAGIKVNLAIPEEERGAKDYSVKLINGDVSQSDLPVDQRDDQSITIKIPVSSIARGSYAIQVFSIKPDGTQQRIPGSYYFDVE